jgi:hypothetical protein
MGLKLKLLVSRQDGHIIGLKLKLLFPHQDGHVKVRLLVFSSKGSSGKNTCDKCQGIHIL